MATHNASSEVMHPPYIPTIAQLGGVPNKNVDIPITAVFLALFICGAATHMTIFQLNKRRGHKFIMSGLMFGFCMSRIVTCTLRIVWATRPTNARIAIAAMIFVQAGVVLLFILNIIFMQRIIRASHPHFGWYNLLRAAFKIYYVTIVLTLFMIITSSIQSFYTLNHNTRRIDTDILHFGTTYYLVTAFLPIPMVIGSLIVPHKTRIEKFGSGRFRTKIGILLLSASLLTLGAGFRTGINWMKPRPRADPAWYHSKACFYLFDFTIEILVIALYAILRVDRRFHVPDGSHGPGDYVTKAQRSAFSARVKSEEEVFDDEMLQDLREKEKEKDHEHGDE